MINLFNTEYSKLTIAPDSMFSQANKVMSLLEQQCDVFCACLAYPNAMPRNHYGTHTSYFYSS